MSNHYNTLGINKNATAEEIKKAYKKKAKQFHPDLNKSPDAEEKFKEVNEAYKVLSDQKSRTQYDQFGHEQYTQGQKQGGFHEGFSGFGGGGGFGFEDIFGDIFGGFGGRAQRRGADLQTQVDITLQEAFEGTKRKLDLQKYDPCEDCKGTGAEDAKVITCSVCQGSGRTVQQQRTPFGVFQTQAACQNCGGQGKIPKDICATCQGQGRVRKKKTIEVDIPKGVDSGQRIRVTGEGEAGPAGTAPGDLYIIVGVKEHPLFVREGDDLYCEIPISFPQATFGDDVEIPTLKGKAELEIPPGTQSHTRFRISGRGMPSVRAGKGDLYVRVKVQTPKKLSSEQRDALEKFANTTGMQAKPQKGFFDKIKDAF